MGIKKQVAVAMVGLSSLGMSAGVANAATELLSSTWAEQACESFNSNPVLTKELADGWVKNDKGRGFKVIHMYRSDCGKQHRVEMRVVAKDGLAMCDYGGDVQNFKLDYDVDYLMYSTTKEWREMGAGDYGPMMAMMTGALQFKGPKLEAMSVMGPFEQFLLLPGKIEGTDTCPGS